MMVSRNIDLDFDAILQKRSIFKNINDVSAFQEKDYITECEVEN